MRSARLTPLIVALAAVPLVMGPSAAQVMPGSRVRVEIDSPPPARTIVGTVAAFTRDTLSLSPASGAAERRIPTSAIGRLEVSTGRGVVASHVIIGTLGGALAGGLIAGAASSCSEGQWVCFQGLAMAGGVLLGGVAGGVTGLLIKGEHWRTVPLPNVAIFPASDHGVGIAMHIEF